MKPIIYFFISLSLSFSAVHIIPLNDTYVKAQERTYAPGDTLCLEPGRRKFQHFRNLHGTAEKPITLTNCSSGQVLIGTEHYYGFTLDTVSFLHITGSGSSEHEFGIWIDGTSAGIGLAVGGISHHVEIDHIRISGIHFAGIMAKKDFGGNPPDPIPVFDGLHIHHNWIHDVGGEGMYLGETKSPGMLFKNVRVHHNLIQRTGWDLMQIANMVENIEVDHNVMIDGGLAKETYHQNGFQVGDNTFDLRFHHNFIANVHESLVTLLTGGTMSIDSNYLANTTNSFALFADHRNFTDTGAVITLKDNLIRSSDVEQYMKINNDLNRFEITGNRLLPGPDGYLLNTGASLETVHWQEGPPLANEDTLSFVDPRTDWTNVDQGGGYLIASDSPFWGWGLGFGDEERTNPSQNIEPFPSSKTYRIFRPGFDKWNSQFYWVDPTGKRIEKN